ncbi:MAG: D-alanyl-D-alanine carboxypeptidase family protein [Eubacteriales bacterium]
MQKKCVSFLLIITIIILSIFYVEISAEEEDLNLYALSALLMDGDNGRVLWDFNGEEQRAMASTTKIMTGIIALEYGNLEDEVLVSRKASLAPIVKLYIREGEKYRLGDLLYALMLESSNDVAIAIAEHIGGSVEEFCELMTEKAKDIGAHNTSFKTPNGLDAEGHYTTAYDLALIARYALNNEQFVDIINTKQKVFNEVTNNRQFSVNNKNLFLDMMDGAIGVKTGFTNHAGYCFVGAVKKDGKFLISVVLASGWPYNRNWKWQDTQKIMEYGLDNFEYKQIVQDNIKFDIIQVIDGKKGYVNIDVVEFDEIGLLLSKNDKIRKEVDLPTSLEAPIDKGTTIGYYNVYLNDEIYEKLPIKTMNSVDKIDYRFCLYNILKRFLLN